MKPLVFRAGGWIAAAAALLLGGCATFTYESESWQVAAVSSDRADAIVRYVGMGVSSKNVERRAEMAERLKEMAADTSPSSPFTSQLRDARRKVYLEGDKIVLEESGTIRNPLSWFEQTGLNPLSWFTDPCDLSMSRRYIVKAGWDDDETLLATNGRVVDEDTYATLLAGRLPALRSDTQWQRPDELPLDEVARPERLEMIVWPREARMFYWKFSGPSFKKDWASLAPEFSDLMADGAAVDRAKPPTEPDAEAEKSN